MNKNQYSSFTLLEVLIVLSISMLLIGWPVLKYQRWLSNYSVVSFFSKFETEYKRCQQNAMLSGKPSRLKLNKLQNLLEAEYYKVSGEKVFAEWHVPKEVILITHTTIVFNGESGNIGHPALKVYFFDKAINKQIAYTVNVGSGKLEKNDI